MMPEVVKAHEVDQAELDSLASTITKCETNRDNMVAISDQSKTTYDNFSPAHKTCRTGEAGIFTAKQDCHAEKGNKQKIMVDKCGIYDKVDKDWGEEVDNAKVTQKQQRAKTPVYLYRTLYRSCGYGVCCGAERG